MLELLYEKTVTYLDWNPNLLTPERIQHYARQIDSPTSKCWAFIDGTIHPICRPSGRNSNQKSMYSGRKKKHCLQFQAITTANGIFVSFSNAFPGSAFIVQILGNTHDYAMFLACNTDNKLDSLQYPEDDGSEGYFYHIYGDKGYQVHSRRFLSPRQGNVLTPAETLFNNQFATLRVSTENMFAKLSNLWPYIDFYKNQKLQLSPLPMQCKVIVFLTNCHTCFYGNQISTYFNCAPPSIRNYTN